MGDSDDSSGYEPQNELTESNEDAGLLRLDLPACRAIFLICK